MFYEKGRRLGELNEKIKRKAHVKQSFSLDFLERGTFTEYPPLETPQFLRRDTPIIPIALYKGIKAFSLII